MDRALVIGAFDFLGFHFCRFLLEEGFEVVGVPIEYNQDHFLNEKRLEFGRNANFQEVMPSRLLSETEISDQTLIVCSFYDFFVQNRNKFLLEGNDVETFLQMKKDQIRKTQSKVVSLLPIQYKLPQNEHFIHHLDKDLFSHQIFLPTIYGPWQANTLLFQQSILKLINSNNPLVVNECEWIYDTIYINDIMEPILQIAETEAACSYILKSDVEEQWKKCADYLSIPEEMRNNHSYQRGLEGKEKEYMIIKSKTDYISGLEQQKHLLYLFQDDKI